MRNVTQGTISTFFSKIRTLFSIFKKGKGDLPSPPAGCALVSLMDIKQVDMILWNQNKIWILTFFYVFNICQSNAPLNIDGPNFIAVIIYIKKILLYSAYQDEKKWVWVKPFKQILLICQNLCHKWWGITEWFLGLDHSYT